LLAAKSGDALKMGRRLQACPKRTEGCLGNRRSTPAPSVFTTVGVLYVSVGSLFLWNNDMQPDCVISYAREWPWKVISATKIFSGLVSRKACVAYGTHYRDV